MSDQRFFWFSYHSPEKDGTRTRRLHLLRDGIAFAELSPILQSAKFRYENALLNLPGRRSTKSPISPAAAVGQTWSFLTSKDLLVLPTRPPLNDDGGEDQKKVARSYTWLEEQVFQALGARVFAKCVRSRVELAAEAGADCQYAVAEFHSRSYALYAGYKSLKTRFRTPTPTWQTAGYLIHTVLPENEHWKKGPPRLLAVFGMSGESTAVFAALLRTKHFGLLSDILRKRESRLVIFNLRRDEGEPPAHPIDFPHVAGWTAQPVWNVSLSAK